MRVNEQGQAEPCLVECNKQYVNIIYQYHHTPNMNQAIIIKKRINESGFIKGIVR